MVHEFVRFCASALANLESNETSRQVVACFEGTTSSTIQPTCTRVMERRAKMMQCQQCGARYPDNYLFCGVDGQRLEQVQEADPLLGHVIAGAYRIQQVLGSGGYGVVYLAAHERLPMKVAVKILARRRAQDAVAVARFKREVETEAVVRHPNVVKVIDYGHDAFAGYFIVMEYFDGEDLGARLEEGRIPHVLDTFEIIEQAGSALGAAHELGIVHRDVKADNVFLVKDASRPQGFAVKLLDFGVAKLTKPIFQTDGSGDRAALNSTMASTMLGSPCTVSPEILRGTSADLRADVYSFAAMLFEMFTGEILFAARNVEAMLERIVTEPAPVPSTIVGAEWIIPELDALLLQALEKRPDHRPSSMAEFVASLEAIRTPLEKAWAAHFLVDPALKKRLITWKFETESDTQAAPGVAVAHTHVYTEMKPLHQRAERDKPLVMVVDDDRVIRGIIRSLVTRPGFDCETHASAAEAKSWMTSNLPPDAMVLDILMPGLDGISLLKELRTRGYEGHVIVCSSAVNDVLRTEVSTLKSVDIIDKAGELHLIPGLLEKAGLASP